MKKKTGELLEACKNGGMVKNLLKRGVILNIDNKEEKKMLLDIIKQYIYGTTHCEEIMGEFYKKGKSEQKIERNLEEKLKYYMKFYNKSKDFTQKDIKNIAEIDRFFKEYKIKDRDKKWDIEEIRKINKSIDNRWSKSFSDLENKRAKEKLGAFYNNYKQYQGEFVNISHIYTIEDFMRKNPSLKDINIDIKMIKSMSKLEKEEKEDAINKLLTKKSKSRFVRLRAGIKRIIYKLKAKILKNKVFKRKTKGKKMNRQKGKKGKFKKGEYRTA